MLYRAARTGSSSLMQSWDKQDTPITSVAGSLRDEPDAEEGCHGILSILWQPSLCVERI